MDININKNYKWWYLNIINVSGYFSFYTSDRFTKIPPTSFDPTRRFPFLAFSSSECSYQHCPKHAWRRTQNPSIFGGEEMCDNIKALKETEPKVSCEIETAGFQDTMEKSKSTADMIYYWNTELQCFRIILGILLWTSVNAWSVVQIK